MKLETYLSALVISRLEIANADDDKPYKPYFRRLGQFEAIFARILRMDAEKDVEIERLCGMVFRNMSTGEIMMDEIGQQIKQEADK